MIGYIGENLPSPEAWVAWVLQNDSEDTYAWEGCWFGFRYMVNVVANALAEYPEALFLGFRAELDTKDRCQGQSENTCVL